ncbi:MAG: hypothetical protein U5O39_06640 [Gammaproteobacteria bacterium]|nr:hypothetical protein [Gammaproteobacteria bacterium]
MPRTSGLEAAMIRTSAGAPSSLPSGSFWNRMASAARVGKDVNSVRTRCAFVNGLGEHSGQTAFVGIRSRHSRGELSGDQTPANGRHHIVVGVDFNANGGVERYPGDEWCWQSIVPILEARAGPAGEDGEQ